MSEPAAYHEAGHWAAFLHYGCRVKLVAIPPTGAEVARILTHRERGLTALRRAICTLAGPAAELLFTGAIDCHANRSDLDEARELLDPVGVKAAGAIATTLVLTRASKRPFEKPARWRGMTRRSGRAGGLGKGVALLGGTLCGQRRAGSLSATLARGRRSATSSTPYLRP